MDRRPRVLVRPACPDDVTTLVALLELLFAQEADFTPNPARQRQALETILQTPSVGQLLVAECSSVVVGMVSILFTFSTAEGGAAAWLEDMVVHPNHRGRGIGSTLLEAAILGCKNAGIRRITLLTDVSNTKAQQLYERYGFTRSAMVPYRVHFSVTLPNS